MGVAIAHNVIQPCLWCFIMVHETWIHNKTLQRTSSCRNSGVSGRNSSERGHSGSIMTTVLRYMLNILLRNANLLNQFNHDLKKIYSHLAKKIVHFRQNDVNVHKGESPIPKFIEISYERLPQHLFQSDYFFFQT